MKGASSRCWMLVALACALPGAGAWAAETAHQLSGGQIRARFSGNVLTDETHWSETYAPGGKLLFDEMSSGPSVGSWRVEGDRLCRRRPDILNECYSVWIDGDRVELRHPKYPPLEGVLRRKPAPTHHS